MSVAYLAYRVKNRSLYPPGWRRLEKETLRSHPFCSFCGAPKPLQVHHINPVHLHPEMALDASNLIVLCQPCHHQDDCGEVRCRRQSIHPPSSWPPICRSLTSTRRPRRTSRRSRISSCEPSDMSRSARNAPTAAKSSKSPTQRPSITNTMTPAL